MKELVILFVLTMFCFGCGNEQNNFIYSTDGVKISYAQQGKNNPALIFIHGWGNDKSIWNEQISYFSEKYKVVTIDLPGFGDSGHNRTNWTMEAFGNDVVTVIEKLNLKQVVLIGFSMGGPVVIEAASKVPEKVIGVVLVDNLQNVEVNYPPQIISYLDSVFMDLAKNPTMEKIVGGGFIKKNLETSYERILPMLSPKENTSRTGWSESFKEFFSWLNNDCIATINEVKDPIIAINSTSEPTNVDGFRKYNASFNVKIISD